MNEKDFLSNLDLLVQIGEPLGAFNDKIGQVFLKCYHLRGEAVDAFVRSQIEQRVRRIMRQQILSGLPFKQPQLHKGDYHCYRRTKSHSGYMESEIWFFQAS